MTPAYYNEIDPYCVAWLRNLIEAGLIAPGVVDSRPIQQVRADELSKYSQCHFFAGIGGWSLALRLAGWPDDRPVWTGSCPCQPFSAAGKRSRQSDERHLWPYWARIIGECRPPTILGEQVARAVTCGWLDDALRDLETFSYSCTAVNLTACAAEEAHERERVYFAADRGGPRLQGHVPNGQPAISSSAEIHQRRELSRILAAEDWEGFATKSGIRPLAYGVPGRVGQIRAYGNAIVPQVAAEFIAAFMECQ